MLKDKELTVWEEDTWEMIDSFEKKDFARIQEIKDLFKTINYVYYYLDKLKDKSETLDANSEQS